METGEPVESLLPRMVSANAYLGSDVICEALATEAPVVITGRVADPALFLALLLETQQFPQHLRPHRNRQARPRRQPHRFPQLRRLHQLHRQRLRTSQ